jgi:ABC-type sugar transport system permease subunit
MFIFRIILFITWLVPAIIGAIFFRLVGALAGGLLGGIIDWLFIMPKAEEAVMNTYRPEHPFQMYNTFWERRPLWQRLLGDVGPGVGIGLIVGLISLFFK